MKTRAGGSRWAAGGRCQVCYVGWECPSVILVIPQSCRISVCISSCFFPAQQTWPGQVLVCTSWVTQAWCSPFFVLEWRSMWNLTLSSCWLSLLHPGVCGSVSGLAYWETSAKTHVNLHFLSWKERNFRVVVSQEKWVLSAMSPGIQVCHPILSIFSR